MKIAVTGHRPNKLDGYKGIKAEQTKIKVKSWLCEQLNHYKPEEVISGMALGVDQWFAEVAVELGVPFIAAVPFANPTIKWPQFSQEYYQRLLSKASKIIHVDELAFPRYLVRGAMPRYYHYLKMQLRDEWMVDNCDILLAVWNGTSGGTANTVQYAKRIDKETIRMDPNA